ncbi:MAG: PAS domain-containing protein [Planctomycetes bacterium]|nr:PAS domain-containing protein [Planctomycetota bacterium]MBI3845491.1 PAS domain-containing protein [Planctomycetota bacterium]
MSRPPMGRFEEALVNAGDGAFVVSRDGRIVLWNRTAERILGWTRADAVGKACCDVIRGCDANGNRLCYRGCHVMSLVRMHDVVQNFDVETPTKSGRRVWINVSTIVLPGARPADELTAHLFRDVTSTHRILELIQDRREREAESPPPDSDSPLTRREVEILRLLAAGADTKAASAKLHVSPATVRNHVQNLMQKLGVHSRLEAVACARRRRLL